MLNIIKILNTKILNITKKTRILIKHEKLKKY